SSGRELRKSLIALHSDAALLTRLGRIGSGNPEGLPHFHSEALPAPIEQAEARSREERRVDLDALLPRRASVCSECLREHGYAKESWELAPVTVCTKHRVRLFDACPGCHAPIKWERPDLFHCADCAHDLRAAEAVPASESVVRVVSDFDALAPFRVCTQTRAPF